jgi:hypothetical protein
MDNPEASRLRARECPSCLGIGSARAFPLLFGLTALLWTGHASAPNFGLISTINPGNRLIAERYFRIGLKVMF